ncbi:hypothetical protein BJ912DRAFT_1143084 [Pholiota molesta]|nr:hypothetical protein BJ912DRAFT_1143084 [Pholiota molesta]
MVVQSKRAIVENLSFTTNDERTTLERRNAGEVDEQQAGAVSAGEVAAAVRDAWNANFTLLSTLALFIWGLLKDHKQA